MWGWIPGGGTIGTTRWVGGKVKGRGRPRPSGTFMDDLIALAEEVEREDARAKREQASKRKRKA